MKFTVLQENLSKSLNIVSNFISSKKQLPILNNILFFLENGNLKISATNLEISINYWLPVKIEKEGKITLPAKTIVNFISSLPNDKVVFETDKNNVKISCRNYKAVFNGIPAEEFPKIPSLKNKNDKNNSLILKAEKFIEAIKQTSFTASQDESRPILTGLKIDFLDNYLQIVATDGYRLSLKKIPNVVSKKFSNLIIPAKTLIELVKIYSQEKEIKLSFLKEDNQLIFSLDGVEIISRLLEGKFPDFNKIIPRESLTKIIINKDDFKRAVKTASLLAKNSANIIKLKIFKSKLKITANDPEVGKNEIEIEVEKEGEDTQVAFNCRFLQEYLNVLEDKEVKIKLLGPLKPGVFKINKDNSFIHIIMPVRVQD